jgi:hypothetical protein
MMATATTTITEKEAVAETRLLLMVAEAVAVEAVEAVEAVAEARLLLVVAKAVVPLLLAAAGLLHTTAITKEQVMDNANMTTRSASSSTRTTKIMVLALARDRVA